MLLNISLNLNAEAIAYRSELRSFQLQSGPQGGVIRLDRDVSGGTKSASAWSSRRRSCMRICMGIYPHVLTVVNDLAVTNRS
jgi:hypothetical protein